MKKLLFAGLLALLPSEVYAFHVQAVAVARIKVQNVVQRVVVQKVVQQVQVVEQVRFANIVVPTVAVQQFAVASYYQPQALVAPVQQYSQNSCTEQLRMMDKQLELLRAENQNLTLKLQVK